MEANKAVVGEFFIGKVSPNHLLLFFGKYGLCCVVATFRVKKTGAGRPDGLPEGQSISRSH
ncbi:hypothetical protein THTE_0744 [Thermogutta terrifontis]|uniref:Uncharacterized protein n=1 Tax=Thermogutta terrifontis TaxID=1331910 RepID=A0A286RBK7_9BACT|nr:hypothetical protein THTE_0744 [Thermogutta terrifontis]